MNQNEGGKQKNSRESQKVSNLKPEKKEDKPDSELSKSLPEEKHGFLDVVGEKLVLIKNLSEKQILKILVTTSSLASSLIVTNYILRKTNLLGNKSTEQTAQEELQNETNEDTMGKENSKIQGTKSKGDGKNGVKNEDSAAATQKTTSNENIKNQEKKSKNTGKNDVQTEKASTKKNMQSGKEDNKKDVTENNNGKKSNTKPLGVRRGEKAVLYFGVAAIYVSGVIIAALVEIEIRNEKKVTPWIALSWLDVVGQSVAKLVSRGY